ncbi:nuclear factor interleukin-3-regulated protein-like [Neodiprion fabricii]|uniref:nuclear factor interleukin-3-regulated protein-like n=1 Tax=Neodiprion fabricii TaxID=2872261 RepID=UPI001ED8EF5B|nr:nuclear factor interleukin-3-regulated protein-like [Neodiprion fabricii]XP_046431012.1 nuclear factor interleukin-3-regulated protein-like [Neodiprion fabricii]
MGSNGHSARLMCNDGNVSSAFSALHLLRSYSLLAPPADLTRFDHFTSREYGFGEPERPRGLTTGETPLSPLTATFALPAGLLQPPVLTAVPPFIQSRNVAQPNPDVTYNALLGRHFMNTDGSATAAFQKRLRGGKKPIPTEQKDEKYYERRKRNNEAAKKSRDARKIREDHIALKALMLEHENAILKVQIASLREEAQSLRHVLIKQQTSGISQVSPIDATTTGNNRDPRSQPRSTAASLPCRA